MDYEKAIEVIAEMVKQECVGQASLAKVINMDESYPVRALNVVILKLADDVMNAIDVDALDNDLRHMKEAQDVVSDMGIN